MQLINCVVVWDLGNCKVNFQFEKRLHHIEKGIGQHAKLPFDS